MFRDTAIQLWPVLILLEIPGPHRDYLVMFISSQVNQALAGVDFVLDSAHPAFRRSGLKTASVFKVSKLASLSDTMLLGSLGHLDESVFHVLVERLVGLLRSGKPAEE